MKFYKSFFGLSLAAFLLSCGGHQAKSAFAPEVAPPKFSVEPAPQSRDADDVGRFLAGMPGNPGSPFADLEKEEAWKVHRRELDQAWGHMEAATIPGMRKFQKTELSGGPTGNSLAFYPFSGPDALLMTVFFPQSPTYVMVALEPSGTLPTRKDITRKDLKVWLAQTRETVGSELIRSFFITREMDHHFRGQVTDGLLPPILHLLVRSGHTVLGYRYVRLDENGKIVGRTADYKTPGRIGNKGVQVDFRTDADQSLHTLLYFSVNLADDRLRENKPFLTFVSNLKGMSSFFKATSYMTHRPEFSVIRDLVLTNSSAVLQDDSGIPYRYFKTPGWQVQLYGDYEQPYGSFRYLVQTDLRKAYDEPGPKPLGFKIGYGFSKAPSNMLLARREEPKAKTAGPDSASARH